MKKRVLFKVAAMGMATMMLAACGKEEAKPAATEPAAKPATTTEGPMKVAFIYVSPANEEGWSSQHDKGRQALEKHFGDKIQVTTLENIPENADAERVLRDLANQGNKVIFATSFGYMNSVVKVAKDYPNIIFEHAAGYKTAPNMTNYTARFYEGRYLAGKLAASQTKSNILGYVAAFPIPEVLQGINAYTLGARSVNPDVQVRVVWTSSWYDPGKEADATKSLIGQKADVITHHTNSTAVAATCEEAKIPVVSYNSAMKNAAPNMLLAGVVHLWDEYYINRVQMVMDGKWNNQTTWGGAPRHMIDLEAINEKVADPKVVADIKATLDKMAKREFHPFSGPIKNNEGKEVVPAGKTATDAELLNMNYFVEGVVGKVPTN